MTKKTKKNLKLRKQVRRTMGTICLITALVVAAIPVPKAEAANVNGEGTKYTWDNQIWKGDIKEASTKHTSAIPVVDADCKEIYTTGDGTFQFAYVNESKSSNNKIAVILGYNGRNLVNNYLEIPDEVNAYMKYNSNQGSFEGYVAANKAGNPLYYAVYEDVPKLDENGKEMVDEEGEIITEKVIAEHRPCYYNDRNAWQDLELTQFYYNKNEDVAGAEAAFELTATENVQWIKNIKVFYIGNQTLESVDANDAGAVQGWKIAQEQGKINTDPLKGIFANNTNIKTLVIGEYLKGIGNWAFYTCGGLDTVTLGNGLEEIGKAAFADCINLKTVNIPFLSNITFIADYAFQNCQALTNFTLPASVQYIYDHAFDGCWALSNLDIAGVREGANVNLKDLGYYVFKGCTSLQNVTIPASFVGDDKSPYKLVLNNFKDCSNLRSITVQTAPSALRSDIEPVATTGYDDDAYTVQNFKDQVHSTFYFECVDESKTHDFTKLNAIAFKYAADDKYEIIIIDEESDNKIMYQVNSQNQLLHFEMSGPVAEVTIPGRVGPYGISEINAGSFSNNCYLKKIVIPSTVKAINEEAFKGCHNLQHVIFENAGAITKIGTDAFATQVIDSSHSINDTYGCGDESFLEPDASTGVAKAPVLTFTGTVGSNIVPFQYAMNANGNINAGAQPRTYITYYSGWPTNLEIVYNYDNNRAELVDYPTFTELSTYTIADYPYMEQEYIDAADKALEQYNAWINSFGKTEVSQNQWSIINSALNVVLPEGVTGLKSGLFNGGYVYNEETKTGSRKGTPDTDIQSITMASIEEFEPYSFSGCTDLATITINGGVEKIHDYAFAYEYTKPDTKEGSMSGLTTFRMVKGGETIGDYAFQNNAKLANVTISPEVTTLGLRPFKDCTALTDVSFSGGPYFVCTDSVIYGTDDDVKLSVVQCLESRSRTVSAKELTGVKTLNDEAFMDCENIGSIDLSLSYIERVPQYAFANTSNLFEVILPSTCKSISNNAFTGSGLQYAEIPGSVTFIDPSAFDTYDSNKIIEFYCEPGSAAETYANEYENIVVSEKEIEKYFTVTFWDYNTSGELAIVKEETLLWHTSATAPEPVGREGYRFTGWSQDFSDVSRDMDVQALYEKIDSEESKYTVTFLDWDDTVLYTQMVSPGGDAITPQNPSREGYTFTGWRPAITNIKADTTTYAQYERGTLIDSDGDGVPDKVVDEDNNSGNNGSGGSGNGGSGGNSGTTDTTLYTLTVKNGTGSGSYAAGAQVPVIANEPAKGQRFDKWVSESANAKFISNSVAATFFTMPAENIIIEATYEKDPNYSSNSGNSGSNNNNGNNNNNSGSSNKPGTIIVIDKNGLSNTGVVSGTVHGSSDNFVIKITEDTDATEEVLKALLNEYGSVKNLKYFPMDISLYDSTGKTKITDTSGLSITITLPLPDSMIKYAGNNKVAGVVNERLDKLSTRFATIDGVACVTFTAEHFSPYVIYVDVTDLSSPGTTDSSPKTGDIHPKWFFVMGLGCLAVFLFLKKDKKEKAMVV